MSRLRRSCLAVPGSSEKMLVKAAGLPADQVFLDLEDSVAPAEKNDTTRARVVAALTEQSWTARTRVVRVNAVGTPWCFDDIVHVVSNAASALDCLMLPKVESVDQVHFVDHLLTHLERASRSPRRIGLEIQIESPRGLNEVERIACASDRIETLIFGPGDYAASAGIPQLTVGVLDVRYPGDQWHYVLSRIATVAKANGLQAIDGPSSAIRDVEGFRKIAERSRLLGFDGKWALHPDQIGPCNEMFSPTQSEFDHAHRILAAYETATETDLLGAVMLDTEMIDEASRKMAEQVVERGVAAGMTASSEPAQLESAR